MSATATVRRVAVRRDEVRAPSSGMSPYSICWPRRPLWSSNQLRPWTRQSSSVCSTYGDQPMAHQLSRRENSQRQPLPLQRAAVGRITDMSRYQHIAIPEYGLEGLAGSGGCTGCSTTRYAAYSIVYKRRYNEQVKKSAQVWEVARPQKNTPTAPGDPSLSCNRHYPRHAVVRLRAVCHLARVQIGPEDGDHAVHANTLHCDHGATPCKKCASAST